MDIVSELNANEHNPKALRTILAPSWVSSPKYRGTTNILWSCLVTLIACIYTAIHLNIPNTASKWRILLLKGKWVLIALIAPEIVLFCAFQQWAQARNLVSSLNKLRKESEQARQQAPQDFDMRYGFFVVMGGLRVSTGAISDRDDIMALNVNGVLELAHLGNFIYISPEEIEDKSKASLLQKSLVICQVLWMVIQCITRQIYGLPLTSLEIHTMVHVFCALLMYLLWLKKPLDIAASQLIDRDMEFNHIIAFMLLESDREFRRQIRYIVIYPPFSMEVAGTTHVIASISEDGLLTKRISDSESPDTLFEWVDPDPTNGTATLNPGQALKCGFGLAPKKWFPSKPLTLSPKRVELWSRAAAFVRRYDSPGVPYPQAFTPKHAGIPRYIGSPRYADSHFHEALDTISSNFPKSGMGTHLYDHDFMDFWHNFGYFWDHPVFATVVVFFPMVYGGIHLTALRFKYPTKIELLFWKIACIDIMATIPALAIITTILILVLQHRETAMVRISIFFNVLANICLLMYGISRAYLVIESFISLRSVPIGVFWTPSWVQMLPHL